MVRGSFTSKVSAVSDYSRGQVLVHTKVISTDLSPLQHLNTTTTPDSNPLQGVITTSKQGNSGTLLKEGSLVDNNDTHVTANGYRVCTTTEQRNLGGGYFFKQVNMSRSSQ